MGQGGFITLVNGTQYDWNLSGSHSYQMNSWDFPAAISAGRSARIYVEWDQNIFHHTSDDAGEATYSLAGTPYNFQVQARADNNFDLKIYFDNLTTSGNTKGSTLDLGWRHDGQVTFLLAGQSGAFVGTVMPSAWMQGNLASLGNRTLRRLCMPGSHDAGMSTINGSTAFGYSCNTITQRTGIGGQLALGSRYFDIRPVISGGNYFTGHYGYIDAMNSWQGCNGQSIQKIVDDINAYTASNAELVVLKLSHDLNTDVGNSSYRAFTQDEWNGLFNQLSGISNLYTAPAGCSDLTQLKLNDFIAGKKAAVVLVVDPSNSGISLGDRAGKGFYTASNYPVYDSYANSNNVDTMANDQFAKMKAQKQDPNSTCFLLSWTLTQDGTQATTCFMGAASSILNLADTANPELYNRLPAQMSAKCFPNILYIDSVDTSNIAAMAMAVNSIAAN